MYGAGIRFFAAVRDVAVAMFGSDHPCTQALVRASQDGDPRAAAQAQDELGRLDPGQLAELMAGAHRILREDVATILERWPAPAGQPGH